VFNLGMSEIVVILVVALVFLGPKKLPELASGLGKMIRELRKATADIKSEIELDETIRKPVEELREAMTLHPEELKRRDRERALREQEERERLEREKTEQVARDAEAKAEAKAATSASSGSADVLNGDKTIAMHSPPVLTPEPAAAATGGREAHPPAPSGPATGGREAHLPAPSGPAPSPPSGVARVPGTVSRPTLIGMPPTPPPRSSVPPPTPAASKLPPPPSGVRPVPPAPAKKA
jgi:Tat protein translocase TatB subunit